MAFVGWRAGAPARGRLSLRRCFLVLAFIGVGAPLLATLVALVNWSLYGPFRFVPDGDLALLELGTFQAARGAQLLGPYSRFGWHHPGPVLFYLMVPLYLLSGQDSLSLQWSSLLIALACSGAMLVASYRSNLSPVFYSTAVLLPVQIASLGLVVYLNPWNPFVTVLPFALMLMLCAGVCSGQARFVPVVVFLASFLVQTHISYVPLVAAMLGATLVICALPPLRDVLGLAGSRCSLSRQWLLTSLAIAAAMWLLPLLEQLTTTPGNFSRLYEFYSTNREGPHKLFESFELLSREMPGPLLLAFRLAGVPLHTGGSSLAYVTLALLQGLLVHLAWYQAVRARLGCRAALCTLGALGFWVGLWATTRIIGALEFYLVMWASGLGLVQWIGIASVLVPRLASKLEERPWLLPLAVACGVAAIVLTLGVSMPQTRVGFTREPSVRYEFLASQARRYWDGRPGRPLLVRIHHPAWPVAAAVILDLVKQGVPVSVDESWAAMFGSQLTSQGEEVTLLLIASKAHVATMPALPRSDTVAEDSSTLIYGQRFPTVHQVGKLKAVVAPLGYRFEPGQPVPVWVRTVSTNALDRSYSLKARLVSWDGSIQVESAIVPSQAIQGPLPVKGVERESTLMVPLPSQAARGVYRVEVELFLAAVRDASPATTLERAPAGPVPAGHVLVASADDLPEEDGAARRLPLFGFGDNLDLVGIGPVTAARGAISLDLYWRARHALDRDYTITVQLLTADGRLLAQTDGYPWGGGYPTSFWKPGQTVVDSYKLTLPSEAPLEPGSLIVAVYSLETMERLPVADAAGRAMGDYAPLTWLDLP